MLSDTVLTSLLAALFSFVYIFQMAGFAPVLVAPALLSIGGLLTLTFLTGLIRQKHSRRLMELSAKLDGMVFGLLGGIQKIKLAGAERRAFARWAAQYKELGRLRSVSYTHLDVYKRQLYEWTVFTPGQSRQTVNSCT